MSVDEFTPEQTERLAAWVAVRDPFWVRPATRLLLSLHQADLATWVFHWTSRRAVRLYREGRR